MRELALGVDFGTSGVRLAVNDRDGQTLIEQALPYPGPFELPETWRQGFIALLHQLPAELKQQVLVISLAGTSGTLLLCDEQGLPLPGALGHALPYHQACEEQLPEVRRLLGPVSHPASQASGSLARALHLIERSRTIAQTTKRLIRHQADWLMG